VRRNKASAVDDDDDDEDEDENDDAQDDGEVKKRSLIFSIRKNVM
jgi:hypothetical protein